MCTQKLADTTLVYKEQSFSILGGCTKLSKFAVYTTYCYFRERKAGDLEIRPANYLHFIVALRKLLPLHMPCLFVTRK